MGPQMWANQQKYYESFFSTLATALLDPLPTLLLRVKKAANAIRETACLYGFHQNMSRRVLAKIGKCADMSKHPAPLWDKSHMETLYIDLILMTAPALFGSVH